MRPRSIDEVITAYHQALDELRDKTRQVARLDGQRAQLEADIEAIQGRVRSMRDEILADMEQERRIPGRPAKPEAA